MGYIAPRRSNRCCSQPPGKRTAKVIGDPPVVNGHRVGGNCAVAEVFNTVPVVMTAAITPRLAAGSSPELQSDESIDSNVRLPAQTHLEADRDAIADECPHTASRRERPFA